METQKIVECINCGSRSLRPVLDLGRVALPTFPKLEETALYAPLALQQCGACDLVMLVDAVEKDALYSHYYYRSGLNESMVVALAEVAHSASRMVDLQDGDVVLDIGANDGTLLNQYPGFDSLLRVGFDPSDVVTRSIYLDQTRLYRAYFPPDQAWSHYIPKRAKIITCCAMFYDLLNPRKFLLTVREWLDDDGVFVVQMPDLRTMLERVMVDNICHEHVAYWPNHTFLRAARECGLQVHQISHNAVNGGSVRYSLRKCEPCLPGLFQGGDGYHRDLDKFVSKARQYGAIVADWVRAERDTWAYGASTKGITLLSFLGLKEWDLVGVADRNPEKWGRWMPVGSGAIPIVSEDAWREANPPQTLILPWGFTDAFLSREKDYLRRGGRFIVPLPVPRMIGGASSASLQQTRTPPEARHRVPT